MRPHTLLLGPEWYTLTKRYSKEGHMWPFRRNPNKWELIGTNRNTNGIPQLGGVRFRQNAR